MIGAILRPQNGVETALRIALLALIVVFGMECIYFFLARQNPASVAGVNPNDEIVVSGAPHKLPPIDHFDETVERSLFSANRKPIAPERQATTANGNPSERWTLSGIIDTGAEVHVIFAELAGGQTVRLQQGMYLEQWQVGLISADKVTLTYNGEEDILPLQAASKPQELLKRRRPVMGKPPGATRATRPTPEAPAVDPPSAAKPDTQNSATNAP
tara:strand:- start:199 stop:843 length:645 start_codon:yes stop_codon:yes gene_type:complete